MMEAARSTLASSSDVDSGSSAATNVARNALSCVLLRVRLRAQRRALWLSGLWQHESDPARQRSIAQAEVEACLEGWDSASAEHGWRANSAAAVKLTDAIDSVESALRADSGSRLEQLERLFGLDAEESDLLQACLAIALDPSLGRAFAYLQDHSARSYVTSELVRRLFDHARRRVLTPESPLRRWQLVSIEATGPGEPAVLSLDPLVHDWLCGESRLDEALVGIARVVPQRPPLERWAIAEVSARVRRALESQVRTPGSNVRVQIVGHAGTGRRTLAAGIAGILGLPLLCVDCDRISEEDWSRCFLRAQRQAFLDGYALAWAGDSVAQRGWPDSIPTFPIQFLIAETGGASALGPGGAEIVIEMPLPELAERATLWREFIPAAREWPGESVTTLAGRHRPTLTELSALSHAAPATALEAATLLRESSRYRLGELARFVECPFVREDLILPATLLETIDDFVYEASDRAAFWEQTSAKRLFPQGQGLFALMVGPPGTGKTMAAQVIAARLGLDLFRISLAAVVSKYIGETSKNLQRILARAEHMDAVLLFDEADALFGKRTEIKDAHDRFANIDTDYLLQAIEAYRGVAMLATNKRSNIDSAFIRRLRYVLEFPKPDAAQRRELWRRLVVELAGADCARGLEAKLHGLGDSIETTGAQIKYAVLTALFAARRAGEPLGVTHLVRGLDRELLKDGRALSERERERLVGR